MFLQTIVRVIQFNRSNWFAVIVFLSLYPFVSCLSKSLVPSLDAFCSFLLCFLDQVQFMGEQSHLSMDFDKVSSMLLFHFLQPLWADTCSDIQQLVALSIEV